MLLSFLWFSGELIIISLYPFFLLFIFLTYIFFGFLGLPGWLRSFLCEVLGWLSTINVTHERSHIWLQSLEVIQFFLFPLSDSSLVMSVYHTLLFSCSPGSVAVVVLRSHPQSDIVELPRVRVRRI